MKAKLQATSIIQEYQKFKQENIIYNYPIICTLTIIIKLMENVCEVDT